MIPKLFIRTDATPEIGGGHFTRCLALAHAWKERGGQVIFLSRLANPHLEKKLCVAQIGLHVIERPHPDPSDLKITAETVRNYSDTHPPEHSWLVLDGYHFDSRYLAEAKKIGCMLLVTDDLAHLPFYDADIILNQNLSAKNLSYRRTETSTLLLGLEYALIQPQFPKYGLPSRFIPSSAKNILVTMGAADAHNVTYKVLQALALLDRGLGLEVNVVIGPLNPHREMLREFLTSFPHQSFSPVNTDMPSVMAWADLAISAAGSTCWELCFMGVPSLVIEVADNQKEIAENLGAQGLAVNLGKHDRLTVETLSHAVWNFIGDHQSRESFSKQGRKLVDGQGAKRVVEVMIKGIT